MTEEDKQLEQERQPIDRQNEFAKKNRLPYADGNKDYYQCGAALRPQAFSLTPTQLSTLLSVLQEARSGNLHNHALYTDCYAFECMILGYLYDFDDDEDC